MRPNEPPEARCGAECHECRWAPTSPILASYQAIMVYEHPTGGSITGVVGLGHGRDAPSRGGVPFACARMSLRRLGVVRGATSAGGRPPRPYSLATKPSWWVSTPRVAPSRAWSGWVTGAMYLVGDGPSYAPK